MRLFAAAIFLRNRGVGRIGIKGEPVGMLTLRGYIGMAACLVGSRFLFEPFFPVVNEQFKILWSGDYRWKKLVLRGGFGWVGSVDFFQ